MQKKKTKAAKKKDGKNQFIYLKLPIYKVFSTSISSCTNGATTTTSYKQFCPSAKADKGSETKEKKND